MPQQTTGQAMLAERREEVLGRAGLDGEMRERRGRRAGGGRDGAELVAGREADDAVGPLDHHAADLRRLAVATGDPRALPR